MIDPYRLVIVNLAALILTGFGILTYKFIYPKRNPNLFALLIILSLLPLISLLRSGTYESGDLSYNIKNLMEFYRGLSEGHILPGWAGLSNATYGYPLFVFIYPLPYIIGSLFHFLGFSFISSMKMFIAFSFVASGITMYLWVKEEIGKTSAFVASIFYLYTPYHLVDIHFRVSAGEIASFFILPLALFSIKKVVIQNKLRWVLLLTFSLSLLILANQAIALVAFCLIGSYALLIWLGKKGKKIYDLLLCGASVIFSILATAFYWIPAIAEAPFTHQAYYSRIISYVQIKELLYSPWRYGFLFQGHMGELSFVIGYIQIFVGLLACYFLFKKKFVNPVKTKAIFFITGLFLLCFLMTPYSKFIWEHVAILRNFQFTYRLLLFVALCTSFLAGIISLKANKTFIIVLCLAAIIPTILNWGNRRTLPTFNDAYLASHLPDTYPAPVFQPAAPKWVSADNPWFTKIPNKHLEITNGTAEIREVKRTSTLHRYVISAKSNTSLRENTIYFPGWEARLNGKIIPITPDSKKYKGVITIQIPPGLHSLEFEFGDTNIVSIAKLITALTFVLGSLIIIFRRRLSFIPKL